MFRIILFSFFVLQLLSPVIGQSPPKNILFIGVDDLRIELGCYGAKHMKTPNIDALAEQGLLFERAYCQQAICAASRTSLLTGLRPDTTGIYDLNHPLNKTIPNAMSMPRFFKENGYRTISLGKIYHHDQDDKAYWDVLNRCKLDMYALPDTQRLIAEKSEAQKIANQGKGKSQSEQIKGPAVESADVEDNVYSDGHMTDLAIEQLRQKHSKPFFLAVGFVKPHLPFVAPKKYWDLYEREEIAIPSRDEPSDAPKSAFTDWGELRSYDGIPKTGDCSDETTRELIHGYQACVSYVDAQIGRLLKELDRQGLRENTIIVLWGDHGWKLGEYGDWCKHTNFELDTHVPLIFSGAGIPQATRTNALVEYIDIFPTLAESCGLKTPTQCEGKSLLPVFADPSIPFKPFALSQYPRNGGMGYSLRSGSFRFTQWYDKSGRVVAKELYDHTHSEIASGNLANDPDHIDKLQELSDLMKSTNPSPKKKN